jgi:hypothetical protein
MRLKKYTDYVKENIELDYPEVEDEVIQNDIEDYEESDIEEVEEEGHQYEGTVLMNELAERLGTKVVNNTIEYDGQKINFYSETEAFHVGKNKFDTVDEVIDFLTKK